MNPSLILAIDQGGQSSRVAIYSETGEQLCCFSAECTTQVFADAATGKNFIQQDPEDIRGGVISCLQKIQQVLGDDVQYIRAAGFAGQGSSLLCWHKQSGEALTPVLSWQDIRGEDYLQNFPFSPMQVQQLTGLRISPHYGASKMRWCLDHYPKVAEALAGNQLSIGPIVSYIFRHLLQMESLVDPGHAQRTLLWNLAENAWHQPLLDAFNIPIDVLPRCLHHNSFFGHLPLGSRSVPFTASARDQGASLFARGLPERNTCYINIGTGAFIQCLSESLQAPEGLLVSPLWLPEKSSQQNFYAWEATVNGAASAIQYLQEETGLAITPAQINEALLLNPESSCYMLNAIGGLSAPYWRTDLQTQFCAGLTPEQKILAWLESIVFQILVNVRLMVGQGEGQKIFISGGLSNADGLCQKIADLSNMPVHRSDNSDATLQGIACMAAGLPSHWQSPSNDEIFRPQANFKLHERYFLWKGKIKEWLA
ncbi:MAG TPA: FGGY family carbohydrate kinase [Cellvibrio sp.]|nr:FGGY family carbohydrate kinase [Cellvibrio sp.]